MKRAQRFRLEDQRGTEINFELPDFLKDNNTNESKNTKPPTTDIINSRDISGTEMNMKPHRKAPQPAPRLSINKNNSAENSSYSAACDEGDKTQGPNGSYSQGMMCTL